MVRREREAETASTPKGMCLLQADQRLTHAGRYGVSCESLRSGGGQGRAGSQHPQTTLSFPQKPEDLWALHSPSHPPAPTLLSISTTG